MKPIKWNPHHFPVGTVFRLTEDAAKHGLAVGRREFPVASIVRNGINSYVLRTGVEIPWENMEGTHELAYNTEHVEAVVKRGTGPVLIDHQFYGTSPSKFIDKDVLLGRIEDQHGDWKPRRGYHNTVSVRAVVMRELLRVAKPVESIRIDDLMCSVREQTWAVDLKGPLCRGVFVINRKRLRKFVKRNVNRFLVEMRTAIKAEKAIDEAEYNRSMNEDERDFLRENPRMVCVAGGVYADDSGRTVRLLRSRDGVLYDATEGAGGREYTRFGTLIDKENGEGEEFDLVAVISEPSPYGDDEEPPFDTDAQFSIEEKNGART